jgi:hypothetical protein
MLEMQRNVGKISMAPRRHTPPAPILDEFPPGLLLKTFGVKGRKPYHAMRSLQP